MGSDSGRRLATSDAANPASGAAPRVVLDTNVLLSLYVFADSRFLPLRARIEGGEWLALTNERCLEEFRRVLAYPMFSLDVTGQQAVLAAYTAVARRVTGVAEPAPPLPPCKDPDDQKFLELARNGGADYLITSDKALLKLARRNRLRGIFRILKPEAALELIGSADQAARFAPAA